MPEEVVRKTRDKYQEAFERLVGMKLVDVLPDTSVGDFLD